MEFNLLKLQKYLLGIIIFLFIFFGFLGIFYNYGLPTTVGDESTIMATTLKMMSDKVLRPNYENFYYFPLTVYIYMPFFILFLIILLASGRFAGLEALKEFGIIEFAKLLPVARTLSVLFGAASIYLIYKITNRLFNNKWVSLLAAYFLSTSLMFVQLSHFARIWVPQIFFILLAFYFIIILWQKEKPSLKNYFLPALFVGISFGIHLVGLLIYISFFVVHIIKRYKKGIKAILVDKKFWLANILIFLFLPLVFFLNPSGFNNYYENLSGATTVAGTGVSTTAGMEYSLSQGVLYYIQVLFEYEPILVILFLVGTVFLFIRKRLFFYIIYSFIFVYYLVIGPFLGGSHPEPRYILPIIPFMAIVAAFGIGELFKKKIFDRKPKFFLLGIIIVLSFYLPVLWSITIIKSSTRLLARDWLYTNVEPGSSIINFDNYLPLNQNYQSMADTSEFNLGFSTTKEKYLLSKSEKDLPLPNYYIFSPKRYEEFPQIIIDKQYDYVLLNWWDSEEYDKNIAIVNSLSININEPLIIFPKDSTPDTKRMDIANNMREPLKYLPGMKITGPSIAIYKIIN